MTGGVNHVLAHLAAVEPANDENAMHAIVRIINAPAISSCSDLIFFDQVIATTAARALVDAGAAHSVMLTLYDDSRQAIYRSQFFYGCEIKAFDRRKHKLHLPDRPAAM